MQLLKPNIVHVALAVNDEAELKAWLQKEVETLLNAKLKQGLWLCSGKDAPCSNHQADDLHALKSTSLKVSQMNVFIEAVV